MGCERHQRRPTPLETRWGGPWRDVSAPLQLAESFGAAVLTALLSSQPLCLWSQSCFNLLVLRPSICLNPTAGYHSPFFSDRPPQHACFPLILSQLLLCPKVSCLFIPTVFLASFLPTSLLSSFTQKEHYLINSMSPTPYSYSTFFVSTFVVALPLSCLPVPLYICIFTSQFHCLSVCPTFVSPYSWVSLPIP